MAGTNVLTIQVHNTCLDSSELSFIPCLLLRRQAGGGVNGNAPVVINEVFGRMARERWVEVLTTGSATVDLAGFQSLL